MSRHAQPVHPTATALGVAVVLLAFTMRGPIVAVSAVVDRVQSDLGVGATAAGLLTSLPVLCFALGTPLVSVVIARAGLRRGVLGSLAVLGAGIVVRSLDGLPAALVGTGLIGLAITLTNVAVPVLIGSRLSGRRDLVLGVYTAALNVGSMITLSLTVPVADAVGWRWALAVWVGLVLLAAVVWWRTVPGDDRTPPAATTTDDDVPRPWWRRPAAWLLVLAFAGQAFSYYAVTAWLPSILGDLLALSAAAAGPAAAVFQVAAVAGALGVPFLLVRRGAYAAVLVTGACWLAAPLGLLLATPAWPVWCALGGAGQGAGLTLIFALVVRGAADSDDNRRTSAAVQGGGYLVAATGPTVLGALHESTGGWTAPLLAVVVALVTFTLGSLASALASRRG